jgi:hypothetical protein
MTGNLRLGVVAATALGAVCLSAPAPSPALASPAAGDGYSGWTACSIRASAKPTHECKLSQTKAAFFVSKRHDATYKVCVKFPGKKRRLCASAQPAPKGEKRYVTIATSRVGTHKVTWYVAGEKVDSWRLEVVEG